MHKKNIKSLFVKFLEQLVWQIYQLKRIQQAIGMSDKAL